jgi:hypothetical protein
MGRWPDLAAELRGKNMKAIRTFFVAAILATLSAPALAAERPAFDALPADLQELFTRWVRQDCRVDTDKLVSEVIQAGPILEDAFWEAFDAGPTDPVVYETLSSAKDRYELRAQWLDEHGPEAMPGEIFDAIRAEDEPTFEAAEASRLGVHWKDASLSGLALVCTDRSVDRLKRIAENPDDPSAAAAQQALEDSNGCSPR